MGKTSVEVYIPQIRSFEKHAAGASAPQLRFAWASGAKKAAAWLELMESLPHGEWNNHKMRSLAQNHARQGVSAPLLLDVADALQSSGLRDAGYVYVNSDDGWLDLNRTADGSLHPTSQFTNASVKELSDWLHRRGFKFGLYLAAGQTTCGLRAGTLYSEFRDAQQLVASGVDYLKVSGLQQRHRRIRS